MSLDAVLPYLDFPSVEWAGRAPTNWLWDFEKDLYLEKNGHAVFSEEDVVYSFNRHGYRSPELDCDGKIRMLSIGCSYGFGYALPVQFVFHEVVREKLVRELKCDVVNWNLSIGGASNDYIFRTLALCLPRLKPDLTLVNFTWPSRREYICSDGSIYHFLPSVEPVWSVIRQECYPRLMDLFSAPDNQLNLFRNYKGVSALLQNSEWLFSATRETVFKALQPFIELDKFVGGFVKDGKQLDTARDHSHPGPLEHAAMAENYWARMISSGIVERLAQKL